MRAGEFANPLLDGHGVAKFPNRARGGQILSNETNIVAPVMRNFKNPGNCSGHLSTLFLAIRNDARSHIGAVAARMSETTKTVEFMAGSANLDRKLT